MGEVRIKQYAGTRILQAEHPALQSAGIDGAGLGTITGECMFLDKPEGPAGVGHFRALLAVRGSGEVLVNGEWIPVAAPCGWVIAPDAPRGYRWAGEEWELLFVRFDPRVTLLKGMAPGEVRMFPKADPSECIQSYQALYEETMTSARPTVMRCIAELLGFHCEEWIRPDYTTNLLRPVWQAILAAPARSWTLEILAELAGMNRESFRTVCKSETGLSPMRYVAKMRMKYASHMLKEEGYSVRQAGEVVGYLDPYNFSTAFKQVMGLSPRKWLAAYRAEHGKK